MYTTLGKGKGLLPLRSGVKALSIGINYPTTRFSLQGCINDTERIRDLLLKQYGVMDPVIMTDGRRVSDPLYPSRDHLVQEMRRLVDTLGPGEAGFIHFSGHGVLSPGQGVMLVPADAIQSRARDLAEPAGKALSHQDIHTEYMLHNDTLWDMFSRLRQDASLFLLIDACHSGELIELPYLMTLGSDPSTCSIVRSKDRDASGMGSIVMLSACTAQQKSADTQMDGRPTGALTFAFCEALKANPNLSYLALVKSLRSFMDQNLAVANFKQTPQLSFSRPSDCLRPFRIGSRGIGSGSGSGSGGIRTRGIEAEEATGSRLVESTSTFWNV